MSDLLSSHGELSLTRYVGPAKAHMVQITGADGYVQLTEEAMRWLAVHLLIEVDASEVAEQLTTECALKVRRVRCSACRALIDPTDDHLDGTCLRELARQRDELEAVLFRCKQLIGEQLGPVPPLHMDLREAHQLAVKVLRAAARGEGV
jgi:hypothetical protein